MLWLYCLVWSEFACGSVCLALFLLKVLIFGVSIFIFFYTFYSLLPLFTPFSYLFIPFNTFSYPPFLFFLLRLDVCSLSAVLKEAGKMGEKICVCLRRGECVSFCRVVVVSLVAWLCCVVYLILLPAKCRYACGVEEQ